MFFALKNFFETLPSLFYMSYTYRIIVDAWALLLELLIYLVIGIIFTALFQAFINKQKLSAYVARNPHLSIIGAAGFGVISPLGTYICIPMAGSLYSKGTPIDPLMAFLVASPILNPTIFMLTLGAFSIEMAFVRLISGVLLGATAGYIFWFMGKKVGEVKTNNDKEKATTSEKNYLKRFLNELKGTTLYMLKYFWIAIIIAAAIKNLITTDQVEWILGSGSVASVIFAAGAGIPLYSCGGAAIPVLYQLSEMGMTQGAILAFFISGPSTRISNLVILGSVFNIRILSIYLSIVLIGAVVSGVLYNLF